MNSQVLTTLTSQRVCSLAVVMPDGTSHSAAMHFCYDSRTSNLYFLTPNLSQKYKAVAGDHSCPASVAIGFSEDTMISLQLDGTLSEVKKDLLESIKDLYFAAFPHSKKYDSPTSAYLEFAIHSWKYANHKTNEEYHS